MAEIEDLVSHRGGSAHGARTEGLVGIYRAPWVNLGGIQEDGDLLSKGVVLHSSYGRTAGREAHRADEGRTGRGGLALFADWEILLSTLVSRETFFTMKLSLFTATIAAGLAMAFAIPASYALSKREFPGKNMVDTLLDIPLVVSHVAFGSAWVRHWRSD